MPTMGYPGRFHARACVGKQPANFGFGGVLVDLSEALRTVGDGTDTAV
jgi:hypothetical protein